MQRKINVKLLNIIILTVLVISTSIVTVCAEKIIASKTVTYSNQTTWIDYNNVHNAVDELYEYCVGNTFAQYLQSLAASGTVIADDGTAQHNMRYTGISPNNYVTFEGEEWRVIGAFNDVEDGNGNKESRVKIIKADPLPSETKWHTVDINIWKNAQLNQDLQAMKYSSSDLVKNAIWYLGDPGGSYSYIPSKAYEFERSTNVASGNDPTWTGKVGLMYPSDYGFASSACYVGTKTLDWYDECISSNWLYINNSSNEWILSPCADDTTSARSLYYMGFISRQNYVANAHQVRPVVYLKSSVGCKNCSDSNAGTKQNPFQLS